MTKALLSVANLRVDYAETTAVRDVSFEVEAGTVFGLIGSRGAGKTSTLSSVATLVEPTYGTIHVCGIPVLERPAEALPQLGFMPAMPALYEDLCVREFLELFASAYAIPRARRQARIDEVLEVVRLQDVRGALAGDLDRGMRTRLVLAKTLLHGPQVLVLDEPASGLDPGARADLAQTLGTLGKMGRAVVVSSPTLAEVESFCTHVGLMEAGRMVLAGRISDVVDGLRPGRSIRLSLVHPDGRLPGFLSEQPNLKEIEAGLESAQFRLTGGLQDAAELLRRLVESDFELAHFSADEGGVQDLLSEVGGERGR